MNTNSNALPHSLETLLTHADWVRALARRLVRDDAEADDVAQEVWRAAIENPPRDDANPRGWLAAVARNAARGFRRGDRRRDERERAGARPESLPSTARLVEEASLSRELAGLVLKLDEPYRTTMLLRWFREMEVDAIAAAQKLPRETVRTRLRRGLELLREKLDLERGGREAWLSAFAPLVRVELAPAVATAGAFGGAWLWMAAAASIAIATWLAWPERTSVREREDVATGTRAEVREVPAAIASSSSRLASTVDAGGAGRDTRSPLPSGQVASTLAAEQTRAVDALVVDASQRPIVGLSIEWRRSSEPYWDGNTLHTPTTAIEIPRALRERLLQPRPEEAMDPADWKDEPLVWDLLTKGEVSRAHATSDAQGRIAAQVPVEAVERIVVDPRRTIVAEARDGATGQQIWIVAPTVRLAGIVVDEAGAPIAQTGLSVGPVWDFATPLVGIDVDAIRFLQSPATVTDDQGRFHVDSAPIEPHSVIRVFATGMAETVVQTPDHDELALRSVMKKNPAATLPHVSGLVVGPGGKPVEGAWVECGQDSAQSDASGRFDIELSTTPAERTPLTAVRSGYQAAILADFVKKDMQSVEGVVLRLGGEPLTITGRVVEADGSPIAACHVQLVDGTQAGTSDRTVEELTADDARPEKRTQPNGEFFLGGLQEREYTLMAWHEERGFVARLEHVRAGSKDVELRRDPGAFVEHLSGRLVDTQGTPIEGAQIGIALPLVQARNMTNWYQYGEVVSAAGGAFTLVNVPKSGMSLWVAGEGLAKGTLPMPDLRSPPITVVAAIEVRAHLTVSDPSVTRVRFEDRDGTVVRLKAYRLRTIAGTNVLGRENGAFPAFDVQDSATTAVLMREDGQIVRRAPIAIRRTRLLELDL